MSTTAKERQEVMDRLARLGIERDDAGALRRISMTLHRWHELECGDGNDYASWAIERDEATNVPYMARYPHKGEPRRTRIADREGGAIKRLAAILKRYPTLGYYIQGDPRGAALYLLRPGDVPEGESADSYYSRGICVY